MSDTPKIYCIHDVGRPLSPYVKAITLKPLCHYTRCEHKRCVPFKCNSADPRGKFDYIVLADGFYFTSEPPNFWANYFRAFPDELDYALCGFNNNPSFISWCDTPEIRSSLLSKHYIFGLATLIYAPHTVEYIQFDKIDVVCEFVGTNGSVGKEAARRMMGFKLQARLYGHTPRHKKILQQRNVEGVLDE